MNHPNESSCENEIPHIVMTGHRRLLRSIGHPTGSIFHCVGFGGSRRCISRHMQYLPRVDGISEAELQWVEATGRITPSLGIVTPM